MRRFRIRGCFRLASATFLLVYLCSFALAADRDFTFIHISDEHVPHAGTPATIAELRTLREVFLEPYGVTAVAPSFVIQTGDLTEFGPKAGAWDLLNQYYEGVPLDRYMVPGNHDETWRSLSHELRKLYGSPYYSFDRYGCRFAMLNSAGIQDPRPVIGPEQIEWLRRDLESVSLDTPVFVALHHPLDSREFSSPYETDRLLDVLRPYNVVLVMVGHSHGNKHVPYSGIDMVHGGSAWGPGPPGYQVVSVRDGILRVAYKERGKPSAESATFTRRLAAPAKRYPAILIDSPRERGTYRAQIPVRARIELDTGEVTGAYVEFDGKERIDLERSSDGSFETLVPGSRLQTGAHYARICFVDSSGGVYHRSTCFYVEREPPRVIWRAHLGAASRSTPAVTREKVIVGANDGVVRAFDRLTGRLQWEYAAGGAVIGEPLVVEDLVVFGSEDRFLYCIRESDGSSVWKFEAEDPIYSSAVSDGHTVYFGCGSGAFYAVDVRTGRQIWKNTDASYCIESKPFLADGTVVYGAWDTFVYCVDARTGALIWKCVGKGSSEGVAPAYYSPADCGPVATGGRVYVADRKYYLSVIDSNTGELCSSLEKVSAVALSQDRNHLYLRRNTGVLTTVDQHLQVVWESDVSTDEVPAAPVESNGVVFVCSKRGLVSAVSATDGRVLGQYQATPLSYVLSGVAAMDGVAYVSGTDGSLTAIRFLKD